MAATPLEIFEYEVKMLDELIQLIGDPAFSSHSRVIKNALVESACLHTRILVDILLSKDTGRGDDVRLDKLAPTFSNPAVSHLRSAYGSAATAGTPCWILNKMIAHPTLQRETSFDYTGILKQIYPLIQNVLNAVASHPAGSCLKSRASSSSLYPGLCAKTSS